MKNENQKFRQLLNDYFNRNYIATLLIDMDDVIGDFGNAWMKVYNGIYNDHLTKDHLLDWDTTKAVKAECGSKIYDLLKTPGLFRYIQPMPHAQEVLRRLSDRGFELVIVSDSPRGHAHCEYQEDPVNIANPADDKRAWLAEHFPMISQDNIIFGKQKYRVRGDLLVDDKPETFEIFTGLGMEVLLMDAPYNRHIQTDNRVMNFLDVEKRVCEKFAIHV